MMCIESQYFSDLSTCNPKLLLPNKRSCIVHTYIEISRVLGNHPLENLARLVVFCFSRKTSGSTKKFVDVSRRLLLAGDVEGRQQNNERRQTRSQVFWKTESIKHSKSRLVVDAVSPNLHCPEQTDRVRQALRLVP